jgi:RNA polymerase sigma-70 factor (ECF subfamily)
MNRELMSTEQIWEALSEKLRAFLRNRVSDAQVAEDLLQETFLRLHKKLDDIDDEQRLTAWVFQIARNLVIDHYRSKARKVTITLEEDIETPTDEGGNLNELVEGWLTAMIAQLPNTYRDAVELYELKGMPQQQIAETLGISLSGAKSRVQRGRDKLKALLFDCCSFERDRRGNIIGYIQNNRSDSDTCKEGCDS